MASHDIVETAGAPKPAGHYVQATVHNRLIYVSGQLPVSADGRHDTDAPFETQARQAIANLLAIVRQGGGSAESLLKVTAYIVGAANWPAFNAVYAELLNAGKPARAVVPVPELHHGYLVEIEAVAAVNDAAPARSTP